MNRLLCSAIFLAALLFTTSGAADTGITVGMNIWSQKITGDIQFEGERANVEDDFSIADPENSIKIYFATKDVLPFFPDTRLYYDSFEYRGNIDTLFYYGKVPFREGSQAIIGSQTFGITLFYSQEFTDFIGAHLGIDIRKSSFDITLSGVNASTKVGTEISFSGAKQVAPLFPLLYGQVNGRIPTTSVYSYAEAHVGQFNNSFLIDYKTGIGLEILLGIDMEAGYRQFSYNIQSPEKDIDIDLLIGGTFIDINYTF